ncbi:MAG: YIP1 family protein [Halobacteriales archaeon]
MAPYTPLLRPGRYFADREVDFFRVMVLVGLLVAAGPMTIYGVGWVVTDAVDGTLRVDNPARPPEAFCDEDDGAFADEPGCNEPKQVERDVDALIWEAMGEFAGPGFIAYPLGLLVVTLLLHGGAGLYGTEQGWFPTFAVAAWGLIPAVLGVGVALVALALTVDPVTVAPGDDVGAALQPLEAQIRAVKPYRAFVTATTAAWGGYIWRAGLVEQQGLPAIEASIVAGVVAVLYAAVGLL